MEFGRLSPDQCENKTKHVHGLRTSFRRFLLRGCTDYSLNSFLRNSMPVDVPVIRTDRIRYLNSASRDGV